MGIGKAPSIGAHTTSVKKSTVPAPLETIVIVILPKFTCRLSFMIGCIPLKMCGDKTRAAINQEQLLGA